MNDPRSQAQGLAQYGRYGDSMLMHVNPEELQGLQSLAQANGSSLTINPHTGQPESFRLGQFLKMAAPVAAGFAFGGPMGAAMGTKAAMGGLAAGALTGAGIAAFTGENILMGGLTGAMGGYGGGSMAGAAGNVAAANAAAATTAGQNAATIAGEKAITSQLMSANPFSAGARAAAGAQSGIPANLAANVNPYQAARGVVPGSKFEAYKLANQAKFGGTHQLGQALPTPAVPAGNFETLTSNFGDVATELGGGNKMMGYGKMGLTAGMPLLAGMEPPGGGLSEDDIAATHAYDPYSQLDLSEDTGLRLISNGGLISLANGGDVGLGEGDGDFVTGSFAAGDFAGGDNFNEFAEVTEAGQFNDFNEFNDFANDPLLQEPGGFNPAVNQPLPPAQNNFSDPPVFEDDTESFTEVTDTFSPGRFIDGAGDGLSDSIPATIEGQQEARLSDGEFVVPADVVSGIGNGSSGAGSAQLFDMMRKIRKRRTGMATQPEEIKPTDMTI